jgi:ribosomal protein S25
LKAKKEKEQGRRKKKKKGRELERGEQQSIPAMESPELTREEVCL